MAAAKWISVEAAKGAALLELDGCFTMIKKSKGCNE